MHVALIKLIGGWGQSLGQKNYCGVAVMDLSKSFNTRNHVLLIVNSFMCMVLVKKF